MFYADLNMTEKSEKTALGAVSASSFILFSVLSIVISKSNVGNTLTFLGMTI